MKYEDCTKKELITMLRHGYRFSKISENLEVSEIIFKRWEKAEKAAIDAEEAAMECAIDTMKQLKEYAGMSIKDMTEKQRLEIIALHSARDVLNKKAASLRKESDKLYQIYRGGV